VVNDYRKEGSLPLLNSLVNYQQGRLDAELLNNLLAMRMLFEVETARLAALNRKTKHLQAFDTILKNQEAVALDQTQHIAELDFDFHHLIAMATGNRIYPLLLNSFKQFYCNLARQFFTDPPVVGVVFEFHRKMVQAVEQKDAERACGIMTKMLAHGEEHLKRLIEQDH
jgi:GntR family negative regulator for fad regulon and positive regulator of fabA